MLKKKTNVLRNWKKKIVWIENFQHRVFSETKKIINVVSLRRERFSIKRGALSAKLQVNDNLSVSKCLNYSTEDTRHAIDEPKRKVPWKKRHRKVINAKKMRYQIWFRSFAIRVRLSRTYFSRFSLHFGLSRRFMFAVCYMWCVMCADACGCCKKLSESSPAECRVESCAIWIPPCKWNQTLRTMVISRMLEARLRICAFREFLRLAKIG